MDDSQCERMKPEEVLKRLGEVLDHLLSMQRALATLLDSGDTDAIERLMKEREAAGGPLLELSKIVESRPDLYRDRQPALEEMAARAAVIAKADSDHLIRICAIRDAAAAEIRRLQSIRSVHAAYGAEAAVVPTLQDREA